ncbi:MAG: murein biosynthesis integral membrane protein MurJ [Chloroflexota bacterium]|nr:murein biosynthesis integral membrane protein MurJ [Chloroflexota bacterium]
MTNESATAAGETRRQNSQRLTHISRNTLIVAASFGLAAVVGLVRNVVIAQQFGIGADLDAYFAAFKLPDLLFTIVAGGALATAFIPIFANFLSAGDRKGAWRLASAITNLVMIVVSTLAILAAVAAPWLVETLIAPGFSAAQQAETVDVMRIVLISTVIFGISAVQGSVLHGFKHFLLPALAPVVYPLGIVVGAIFLAPTMGIKGLAIGAVIGSLLNLLIKVPGLIYYGFHWWPVLDLRGVHAEPVRRVLVLMGPRVLDLAVFHATLLAATNLASRLGEGSVSALEWGWDAMQLPETVIGTAFGLVAFPTMAELAARNDRDGLRDTLGETLRAVIAFSVPAAVGLILLGRPLLALLYQRGAFDTQATEAVYTTLRLFALGLVGHVCLELVARAYFAERDTITPLIVAVVFAVVYLLLAIALMVPMGAGGLALANSLAITAEVLTLVWILRRRWDGIQGMATLCSLARVLLASGIMALALLAVLAAAESAGLDALPTVVIAGGIGFLTYLVAGLLLDVRILRELPRALLGMESDW